MSAHDREPYTLCRGRRGASTALVAMAALVLAVGCDREHSDSATERAERAATRVKTGTQELVEKAKRKRAEWSTESEDRLKQLDNRLQALDHRLEQLGDRGAETANETLDRLRKARRDAREALDEARRSGTDAWEGAKQAGDEALDRLEDVYRGAAATLRGDR